MPFLICAANSLGAVADGALGFDAARVVVGADDHARGALEHLLRHPEHAVGTDVLREQHALLLVQCLHHELGSLAARLQAHQLQPELVAILILAVRAAFGHDRSPCSRKSRGGD